MVSTKRKRDSTDSAIADISCSSLDAESFQSGSRLSATGGLRDLSHRQGNKDGNTVRGTQITDLPGFYTGDYGTAASMRPRRQTQFQAPANMADLPPPSTKKWRANKKSVAANVKPLLPVQLQIPFERVSLGTPRRPTRKRRPSRKAETGDLLIHSKKSISSTLPHAGLDPSEGVKSKAQLKSRSSLVVYLGLPNSAEKLSKSSWNSQEQQAQCGDEKVSGENLETEDVNSSFESTDNDDLPYQPDHFAQPVPTSTLLSSQDLSLPSDSQSAPHRTQLQTSRQSSRRSSRQSSPQADSGSNQIETTCSTSQPSDMPTVICRISQTSAVSNLIVPASQTDTVPTLIIDLPHASSPSSSPGITSSALSDMNSAGMIENKDELRLSNDHPYPAADVSRFPIDDPTQTHNQQQLYNLVEQMFAHRKSELTKPEPLAGPAVWADGRQELCETLHYFRSYQSACYCTGGFVRGFMFDKVAHSRDYIDSNVVISRAGGGLVKDKDSGAMKSGRDQVEDTVSQALRNCMRHYNPVVIITGIDNPHVPSKPPHQYCVLDYFKPTHIWVEKSGNSKIVRYRFEKLNAKKESWWRAKDHKEPIELGGLPPPLSSTCRTCDVGSPQIYLNGWMCLQPSCPSFWHITPSNFSCGFQATPYEPDEASLTYDPRFLKQSTYWPNDCHIYPLTSNTVELSSLSIPGEDTSQAFWLGMVCPKCGRCNSRTKWTGWECLNSDCNYKKEPPHTLVPAISLREPLWPVTDSYTLSRDTHAPLITTNVIFAHGYRINRYHIPGIDGFITHMIANKTVLEEPGGPDAMFEELQQNDIGLERRSLPNGQLKGDSYTRHFLVNYGMPYKFIAATASQSFTDAARPITATRSRLNWAASYLLSRESSTDSPTPWKPREFNEILALGYFEAQKINYHDDGEHGLGPTIATLSLGAPGIMRIRMKARHYHGVSSAGVYDDAPPLPGCAQYKVRYAAQPALEKLHHKDLKAWRTRLKTLPRELGLRSTGTARDVLRMELGHGDIVIMHGEALQRYYEHAVEHAGKLRFALTCRYIDPESLAKGDRPGYVVGEDEGGYDGALLGEGRDQ